MEWNELLIDVVKGISYLMIVYCIPAAFNMFRKKVKETEHKDAVNNLLTHAENVVSAAVNTVKNKFTDSLKKEGKFDKAAQQEAFSMAMSIILNQLTEEAKQAITETYLDLSVWLETKIEDAVALSKK